MLAKNLPYQFSLRTTKPDEEVLQELSTRSMAGIGVAERGPHYLVLRPRARYPIGYGSDLAWALGAGIVLVSLILTAVSVMFIVLLPFAIVPALPLLLDHRPSIAISAVPDEDDGGGTRITAHGEVSPELGAALDAYLSALPPLAETTSS